MQGWTRDVVDRTLSSLVGDVQICTVTHQIAGHGNPLLVTVWYVVTQLRVDLKNKKTLL